MTNNVTYASLAVAGLMGLACIADVVTGIPFGRLIVMDVVFLIAAGLIGFLGIDCLKGTRKK